MGAEPWPRAEPHRDARRTIGSSSSYPLECLSRAASHALTRHTLPASPYLQAGGGEAMEVESEAEEEAPEEGGKQRTKKQMPWSNEERAKLFDSFSEQVRGSPRYLTHRLTSDFAPLRYLAD